MATETTGAHASELPQDAWVRWAREHADVLEKSTAAQRVLLEAAVRFIAVIAGQPILLRMAGFFLLHADMGLTPAQVGAAVGRTPPSATAPAPRWEIVQALPVARRGGVERTLS